MNNVLNVRKSPEEGLRKKRICDTICLSGMFFRGVRQPDYGAISDFADGKHENSTADLIKRGRSDEVVFCVTDDSHNSEKIYRRKTGYVVRAFLDEYLMIPVDAPGADDAKMAVLSPVAEFIWSLLQEPRSFEELLEGLTAEFDVAEDVAAADIEEFLKELDSHGFLLKEDGI